MSQVELARESVYGARSGEANPATHIPVLDGVRALSISLVLAGHLLPLGPKAFDLNSTAASLGMALFFCLSGYLIVTFLHRKPDVVDFLIRRVFRIVPALVLFLAVAMAAGIGVGSQAALLNLAFVSNYFYAGLSPYALSHLWSLSVEMQFYVAIALAILLLGRRGLWLVPVAALVVTALRVQAGAPIHINTHLRVDEILSGGCLALFALYRTKIPPVSLPVWAARGGIAVIFLLWLTSAHSAGGWVNYLRPYLTAALVGSLMVGPLPRLQHLLSTRPLRYLANISYAAYLYHLLMASGILAGHGTYETYLIKRPITFLLTWAAAHLSTYYWEKPWNNFGRSRIQGWLHGR